jgi:hypothetical protein
MKVALVVILLRDIRFRQTPAQSQIPTAAAEAACGPNVKFEVEMGTTDPLHLEFGKALALCDRRSGKMPKLHGRQHRTFH